ncbi:MAG: hypothetical protein SPK16_08550, partial [Corynebacterium sp.]|nr:hypothetical protein [Corynebacterium sp.]
MRITVAPRTVAACAAVGIALATTAGTAPIAFAQTPLSAANIDASQSGSITINKRLNPTGTLSEGTGQAVTNAPGEALPGITFKITKL